MTVADLIEKLSKLNQKHKVYLYDGEWSEWILLTRIEVGEFEKNTAHDYLKIDKKKPKANGVWLI